MERTTDRDESPRLLPRLPPDLKPKFEVDYYAHIRPGLRLVSLLLAGLAAAHTLAQSGVPARSDLAVAVPMLVFWLCVFGLTWMRGFGRVWQPTLMPLGWVAAPLGWLWDRLSVERLLRLR